MQGALLATPLPGHQAISASTIAESHPVAEAPSDRLNLAKGSLVAFVLSAGLWAAIFECVHLLRS